MSPAPIRIAIVNDYAVVVAGLAAILAPYSDRIALTELTSRLAPSTEVDIILLDVFAHVDDDGCTVADLVHPGGPPVLLFTWTVNDESVALAQEAGAMGCLSKRPSPSQLAEALETAYATGDLPHLLTEPDHAGPSGSCATRYTGLSPREAEMMAYIAKGLSNREIAAQAYLSVNSVKTYVRTAYKKAGVKSRSTAVLWALENQLTSLPTRDVARP